MVSIKEPDVDSVMKELESEQAPLIVQRPLENGRPSTPIRAMNKEEVLAQTDEELLETLVRRKKLVAAGVVTITPSNLKVLEDMIAELRAQQIDDTERNTRQQEYEFLYEKLGKKERFNAEAS